MNFVTQPNCLFESTNLLQSILKMCYNQTAILNQPIFLNQSIKFVREQNCLFKSIHFATMFPLILLHNQTTFLNQSSRPCNKWSSCRESRLVHFWLTFWHNLCSGKLLLCCTNFSFSFSPKLEHPGQNETNTVWNFVGIDQLLTPEILEFSFPLHEGGGCISCTVFF